MNDSAYYQKVCNSPIFLYYEHELRRSSLHFFYRVSSSVLPYQRITAGSKVLHMSKHTGSDNEGVALQLR